jgi:hypothetical protein
MRMSIPRRPLASRSIPEWCDEQSISVSMYYKLRSQGRAPDTMAIGRRQVITDEAHRRWLAMMQEEAAYKKRPTLATPGGRVGNKVSRLFIYPTVRAGASTVGLQWKEPGQCPHYQYRPR